MPEYIRVSVNEVHGEAICPFVRIESKEKVVIVQQKFLAPNNMDYSVNFLFVGCTDFFVLNSVFHSFQPYFFADIIGSLSWCKQRGLHIRDGKCPFFVVLLLCSAST